jgi:hypothetical protein
MYDVPSMAVLLLLLLFYYYYYYYSLLVEEVVIFAAGVSITNVIILQVTDYDRHIFVHESLPCANCNWLF